jgi:hypothetical protein
MACLLELDNDLVITVKTERILIRYIRRYLSQYSSRLRFIPLMTDIGLVIKPGSMDVDTKSLLTQLKAFVHSWDMLIEQEKKWINQNGIKLIIADIVPWVLKSAAPAGAAAILISNFTWVEIYKELLTENVWEAYLECYQKADTAFIYPFSGEIEDYFKQTIEVGLVCRKFNEENAYRIKARYDKPIVYVSVGKSVELKKGIELEELPYQFLFTEGITLKGRNTKLLPIDTLNTHDYINAADYVVSKAGWGTVAEAVCAHKPMMILKRDEIKEDRVTAHKLAELGIALPVHISELDAENLRLCLTRLDSMKENYNDLPPRYTNCADKIAVQILGYLP